MKKLLILSLIFFLCGRAYTQFQSLNFQKSCQAGVRTLSGEPGPAYWQNTANYDIAVNFDPVSRRLEGYETIVYFNNSPDTLRELVLKLYPNYYKQTAPRLKAVAAADLGEGMHIDSVLLNGKKLPEKSMQTDNTNMLLRVKLLPRDSIKLFIAFDYTLNKGSHNRTGMVDSGSAFIAYFYPRLAVYDDIDGWNRHPYLGTYEFYHDFCNYQMSITLPREYLVWATGELRNKEDIFRPEYLKRISRAESEDGYSFIIDSIDLKNTRSITKGLNGFNTWKFIAGNVTDVAFAFSNHYLWQSGSLVVDSSTGRRARVDAVFHPEHKDYYHVATDAGKTLQAMSFRFPRWPFPYSHETVFDGLDQMEYPMMANDNPVADRAESIELTVHEIFHTLFPFYMGTNETKYGWMDEGWATIGEWLITPMIDSSIVDEYGILPYERGAGREADAPIASLTYEQIGQGAFLNSYPKPALGYLYVMDLLGEELFLKALHHYMRLWNGKHPLPQDFFNCMNSGSGVDLSWFWKRWFYEKGYPDLAIEKVKERGDKKLIRIRSKGNKPVPLDLTVSFMNGEEVRFHKSIDVWKNKDICDLRFSSKEKIKSVRLGSTYVVDINKADNFFAAP